MKACVIQPHYSLDFSKSDDCFNKNLEYLEQCDESMDIIVLPEYSDAPALSKTREEKLISHKKYIKPLLDACATTARRCNAIVFVNALSETETGYRNTTYAFDRHGEIVGKYYKTHIPIGELACDIESDYTRDLLEPYILEIEGIRFAFLTCYDFYFYEAFAVIARQNVDVIIGCSHQRSDTHDALEIMSRFCAYNCNAYLLRSSISMDENSDICGASMIVTPEGNVLANMKGRVGLATAEIDPHKKYYKPAGFGNPPASHYEYIEDGRNPWNYRLGGAPIVRFDELMSYPRVCAKGGFVKTAPKNSLPAFGSAISMGAEEISFDLQYTKDGELVCIGTETIDGVSDGNGLVCGYTYNELLQFDFGVKFSADYKGLTIPSFEEILKKFAGRVIMNIHPKFGDTNMLEKMVALINKYDCKRHVYITAPEEMLRRMREIAPDICTCFLGSDIEQAVALGCRKLEYTGAFTKEVADMAHQNKLICNVSGIETPEEVHQFLHMGADTIMTGNCIAISQALKGIKK